MPVRSGLPSAVLGAGAERSAFPSFVRGVPGIFTLIHCADAILHRAVRPAMTPVAEAARLIWGRLPQQLSFHLFARTSEYLSFLRCLHDRRTHTQGRGSL